MTAQVDYREVGEDFLLHYGKMGMRWGHRNAVDETGVPRTGMSKKKKVAIGVGAAVLVVGVVAVAVVLKQRGISPVSVIKTTVGGARRISAGTDVASALIKQQGKVVVNKAGAKVMDKATEKISDKLADKFDEKVMNKAENTQYSDLRNRAIG